MFSSFALKNLKGRQGVVAVALLVLVTFVAAEAEAHKVEEGTWASFKTAVFFRVFSFLAEQGYAGAQTRLAFMYEEGHGVPHDSAEALRWYRQAAEQRQAMAQFHLGFMYRDGKGVPQSDVQAYQWFTSVAAGLADSERDRALHDSAMRLRSEVASNMTPEQVAEAERLVSE